MTFAKAIEIATQIEDAAKYVKDTQGHSDEHVTEFQKINIKSFKQKCKKFSKHSLQKMQELPQKQGMQTQKRYVKDLCTLCDQAKTQQGKTA